MISYRKDDDSLRILICDPNETHISFISNHDVVIDETTGKLIKSRVQKVRVVETIEDKE